MEKKDATPQLEAVQAHVEEQISEQLTAINTYQPPQLRDVDDDHPVIRFGESAAKSVEESAAAVMAEAKKHEEDCQRLADEIRRCAKEIADLSSHKLKKIHAAGKALQAARETYLEEGAPAPAAGNGGKRT